MIPSAVVAGLTAVPYLSIDDATRVAVVLVRGGWKVELVPPRRQADGSHLLGVVRGPITGRPAGHLRYRAVG